MHGEKIKHVVTSEPPPRKAHAFADLVQDSLLLKVGCLYWLPGISVPITNCMDYPPHDRLNHPTL